MLTHVDAGPHTLEGELHLILHIIWICDVLRSLVNSENPGHCLVLKIFGASAHGHIFTGSCAHMWSVLHKKCCSVALWDM